MLHYTAVRAPLSSLMSPYLILADSESTRTQPSVKSCNMLQSLPAHLLMRWNVSVFCFLSVSDSLLLWHLFCQLIPLRNCSAVVTQHKCMTSYLEQQQLYVVCTYSVYIYFVCYRHDWHIYLRVIRVIMPDARSVGIVSFIDSYRCIRTAVNTLLLHAVPGMCL